MQRNKEEAGLENDKNLSTVRTYHANGVVFSPCCSSWKYKSRVQTESSKRRSEVDGQLARFISEMYALVDETNQLRTEYRLCRSCCERENAKFNASHGKHRYLCGDGDETMNVDDQSMESWHQLESTMKDASVADDQTNENLDSSPTASVTESEDSDGIDRSYRKEQAKHTLNEIFQVLSIPPIVDM